MSHFDGFDLSCHLKRINCYQINKPGLDELIAKFMLAGIWILVI